MRPTCGADRRNGGKAYDWTVAWHRESEAAASILSAHNVLTPGRPLACPASVLCAQVGMERLFLHRRSRRSGADEANQGRLAALVRPTGRAEGTGLEHGQLGLLVSYSGEPSCHKLSPARPSLLRRSTLQTIDGPGSARLADTSTRWPCIASTAASRFRTCSIYTSQGPG